MAKGKELEVKAETLPAEMESNELIKMAISKDLDVDKLEKLIELKNREKAERAEELYAIAFSKVQAKVGSVIRSHKNSQTNSNYADLADITEMVKPLYTEEGFSVIFYEGETPKEGHVRICADVLHSSKHKETYWYDIPLDGVGMKGNANMTKIHGKSSSTSYGRRYLSCMIWNIPTKDNDGNAAGPEMATSEDIEEIKCELGSTDSNPERFLEFLELDDFSNMTKFQYKKGMVAINQKKGENQ